MSIYLKDQIKADIDTVDTKHASNSANNVPILDSNAKVPLAQLPTGTTSTSVALGNHTHSYRPGDWLPPNDHARKHTMTSTSDHAATAGKMFYSDSLGNIQEFDMSSVAGQVLRSTANKGAPVWSTIATTDLPVFTGATSSTNGSVGLVKAPLIAERTQYLRGDGVWATPTDTDTKVTNTLATTTKAYVTGTTSASTNTGTQVFDSGVYLDTTAGMLTATTFKGALSGNASTATTLQTTRSIGFSGALNATATNFNGSANITIPVSSVKEAYLTWGGKDFSGSYGPIDAAMVPELGANRLAFMRGSAITVEYTRDGGATWLDYGASDASKTALFSTSTSLSIGKSDSTNKANANCQLRITIDTGAASVYTTLNKFCIYLSTNGSSGCTCTIQKALQSTPTTFVDDKVNIPVSGWSGYNIINTSGITTYGNTPTSQYGRIRFLFKITGHNETYNGMVINKIRGYGGVGWSTPSTMASSGTLFSYNESQEAFFPAMVSATTLRSTVANGTAPLTITSTTAVTNLNADMVDGKHANNTASNIPLLGSDGRLAVAQMGTALPTQVSAIKLTSAATSTDTASPMQVAYGLVGSYGNLKLLANTDNAAGADNEYVHIAAARGLTPTVSQGLVVYGTKRATLDGADIITGADLVSKTKNGLCPMLPNETITTKYLRQDGTWAIPPDTNTNTASAADNILDGSNSGTVITYAPYAAQQARLSFDTSTTSPTRTDRLNLNGYLYATKLYSDGTEVSVNTHTHGNIASGGTITSTAVTPASTDYLLISDASNSGKVERGVAIGTSTTTYLRNNGTWGTPPNTNTASAVSNILAGSNAGTAITYAPYASQQDKLSFDTSTTNPTRTDRLNLNGNLHATQVYSAGLPVSNTNHQHGNINCEGEIHSLEVTPDRYDFILISDSSNLNTVEKGPMFGVSTSSFLRNDGQWGSPPNTATALDNILDGSNSGTAITYKPYTAQQSKLSFDTSTTSPVRTDRLNLNGYLYATKLYSGGTEVSVSGHSHPGGLHIGSTAPSNLESLWLDTASEEAGAYSINLKDNATNTSYSLKVTNGRLELSN